MRNYLLYGLCLVGVFVIIGSCKTYQEVDWTNPKVPKEERSLSFEPRQLSRIQHGDSLLIVTQDSKKYYVIYTQTENDAIQGVFWKFGSQKIRFPVSANFALSEIEALKVRKYDLGTTLQVVIALPVAAVVIIGSVKLYENIPDINEIFDAN